MDISDEYCQRESPYLVRENLYIGDLTDAVEVLEKGSSDITHILSALSSTSILIFTGGNDTVSIPVTEIRQVFFGDEEDFSKSALLPGKLVYSLENAGKEFKLVRMAVPLADTEDQNLLDYLEVCLDFIDQSRKSGGVLVHCHAGISRSASVMTAYLMRSERLSLEAALKSLQQSSDIVSPSENFLEQLKMFEEMCFKVDHSNLNYKRFRLKMLESLKSPIRTGPPELIGRLCLLSTNLGDSYKKGDKMDSSKFGVDPGLPQEVTAAKPEASSDSNIKPNVAYRCQKCRKIIALQENIVDHVPGEGISAFQWNKRHKENSGNYNKPDDIGCTSIFVEPLKWMKAVEDGVTEGKLLCTHCDARLGYFNWSGIQCNCGSWITPAFQLHKSRMDLSTL